jgi:hypothetical protein
MLRFVGRIGGKELMLTDYFIEALSRRLAPQAHTFVTPTQTVVTPTQTVAEAREEQQRNFNNAQADYFEKRRFELIASGDIEAAAGIEILIDRLRGE